MKKLITMLSALTITSSAASVSLACKTELKGEPIDIEEITADMIINWQNEYKGENNKNEEITVKPEKLGSLENSYIEVWLKLNLVSIFMTKLTGIVAKISKLEDPKILSTTEQNNLGYCSLLLIHAISIDVKAQEENSKIFIATIQVSDLNKAFENNRINMQKIKNFYQVNDTDKKISSFIQKVDIATIENNQNQIINNFEELKNKELDFDFKPMYDLIKGKSATITIDLTDKQ